MRALRPDEGIGPYVWRLAIGRCGVPHPPLTRSPFPQRGKAWGWGCGGVPSPGGARVRGVGVTGRTSDLRGVDPLSAFFLVIYQQG